LPLIYAFASIGHFHDSDDEEIKESKNNGNDALAIEWYDETDLGGQPRGNRRHKHTSRKYTRKIYKSGLTCRL